MTAAQRKRLQALAAQLAPQQLEQLLDFAEFLSARYAATAASLDLPAAIPRPAEESVVKAIKRLAATYPMLDRGKMLNETSMLMTQHIVQGRAAGEVIDELEIIFQRHYAALRGE